MIEFMSPIEPMLAVTIEKVQIRNYADWAIEIKFDGIRLVIEKKANRVTAWTRPRKAAGSDVKAMAVYHEFPQHLIDAFLKMPDGIYDGELLAGVTSTDVKRKDQRGKQIFVMFDVMRFVGADTTFLGYDDRRAIMTGLFEQVAVPEVIRLAESFQPKDQDDVVAMTKKIWDAGGEGTMLKRRAAKYQAGKRSKDVVKVKKIQHEVMVVIGWAKGKGKKVDRGPFAMTLLRSLDGKRETSVKTLDDAELAAFARKGPAGPNHPDMGRRLQMEFNDWTPLDGYRHPRWDRWENE